MPNESVTLSALETALDATVAQPVPLPEAANEVFQFEQ